MRADNISSIHNYTIIDVSTDIGHKSPAKDFLTFRSDELKPQEEILGNPLRSDHFTIALVIEGEIDVQINMVNYCVKKNSLIVIPFNTIHRIQKDNDKSIVIVVCFSHDFIGQSRVSEKLLPSYSFFSPQNNPYLMLEKEDADALHGVIKMLRKVNDPASEHPFKREIVQHGFNIFIYEVAALFKRYRPNEEVKLTRKEEILTSFLKLLSQHFREERGVQFYADALYITPKHLTKIVKELTNKTCGEMIDEIVIIEAKIMLNDLGLPVATVAAQLQFSDQFFFSKFFKKHTGITPSKYKGAIK
ncbi:helix-turn-helix domain-containing protein [Chitinophaga sancti]|uniref:helix-turn-helix domain-containing protein n=1 Tax=Chitinophaga sancti TaxID=1004 RepID=UPI002A74EA41|nr:helix-turn-helix domain-containing protein [Chitinophaga sancti]WPQ61455.1 helix-turn-helix domain-containing protein [Chitinophaga sancti]